MKLLPFPESAAEIPLTYPVYRKGDWQGPQAKAYGALIWFGRQIGEPPLLITLLLIDFAATGAAALWGPWWLAVLLALFVFVIIGGAKLGPRAAENAWMNFHAQLDGCVYPAEKYDGRFGISSRWHEAAHIYQKGRNRAHSTRYTIDPRGVWFIPILGKMTPRYRAHAEAQAYGLQVAKGFRDMADALVPMTKKIYALGLTKTEGFDLLRAYVEAWLEVPGVRSQE